MLNNTAKKEHLNDALINNGSSGKVSIYQTIIWAIGCITICALMVYLSTDGLHSNGGQSNIGRQTKAAQRQQTAAGKIESEALVELLQRYIDNAKKYELKNIKIEKRYKLTIGFKSGRPIEGNINHDGTYEILCEKMVKIMSEENGCHITNIPVKEGRSRTREYHIELVQAVMSEENSDGFVEIKHA